MRARPGRLSYRAKDGLYETHLETEGSRRALFAFINRAIEWGDGSLSRHRYRLLDTFLSDSINETLLEEVVKRARADTNPLEILLADPYSEYAQVRSQSIRQDALAQSRQGLGFILTALGAGRPGDTILHSDLVAEVQRIGKDNNLVLRLYSEAPSGPMYFFKDVLICGRFVAGCSATETPWWMIVDNQSEKGDQFDFFKREFEHIWGPPGGEPHIGVNARTAGSLLTASRMSEGSAAVLFVDIAGFTHGTTLGQQYNMFADLQRLIRECPAVARARASEVVYVCTGDGAAMAFLNPAYRLAPLELGVFLHSRLSEEMRSFAIRQGIFAGTVVVTRDERGNQNCVGTAINQAARVMSGCAPGDILVADSYYQNYLQDEVEWRGRFHEPQIISVKHDQELRVRQLNLE